MKETPRDSLYDVAIALGQIWDGVVCLLTLTLYRPGLSVIMIEKKIRYGIAYRKALREKVVA